MAKSYKVVAKKINMGDHKGETVYTIRPVSYGTLTTDDVARQISAESTATPGDVKAVLDRYAYYVVENLKKGYNIALLGFGTLYLRFITGKAVKEEKKADAKLVKTLIPGFRPSFTLMPNGSRLYDLIPEKITLVKYDDAVVDGESKSTGGSPSSDTGSGTSDSGQGSETGDSSSTSDGEGGGENV